MRKDIDIQFEDNRSVPKYRHIFDVIQHKIKAGNLKKDDKILQLKMICIQYGLLQDTPLRPCNKLKAKGILSHIAFRINQEVIF
jgi:DNA-binding transcriptional MocR family regulator